MTYSSAMLDLLPTGTIWDAQKENTTSDTVRISSAWAEEWQRWDARLKVLLREASPMTAVETLNEWALSVGISDPETYKDEEALRLAILSRLNPKANNNRPQHGLLSQTYGLKLESIALVVQHPVWLCGDYAGEPISNTGTITHWQWTNTILTATEDNIADYEAVVKGTILGNLTPVFNYNQGAIE